MTPRKIKKAYSILDDYNGQNPYVSMLSIQYKRGGKVLNDFEVEYINKNHDYETIIVNKVVKISRELGQKLYEKNNFAFVPEKVKVLKIIGEMGDSYHAYILYRQSEGPTLVYLQKKGILDRLFTVDWRNTEIDFSKYDDHTSKLEVKPFTLAEHQKDGIKFLVSNKKCICADEMGCGKQQPVDTLIPTPNGYYRMGDLNVNDEVFSSDGKIHKVTGVYPQGIQDVYEITFTDKSKTKCGLEHLWIVKDTGRNQKCGKEVWETLSLREILDRGIIRSSRIDKNGWKNTNYRFRIPLTKPVEYNEKKFFIHPYILGMLIGDGYLCGKTVSISLPYHESESLGKIYNFLHENYKLYENAHPSCPQYTITRKKIDGKLNLYKKEIKRLGLNVKSYNKFIPEEYKFCSIEQRKNLLYGLMDSDGTISKTGNKISYTTKSKQLAYDIIELIESLGGMGTLSIQDRSKDNKGITYVVRIQISFCPFTLTNKVKRFTIKQGQKKYLNKTIKNVELVSKEECVCISVDSDDKSYLTNDYIVTHNTITSIVAALESKAEHVLIICPASLKHNWKRECLRYCKPEDVDVIYGSKWKDNLGKFTIINFEIVQKFYEVAEEPVFEDVEIKDSEGKVVEVLKKPVMVKNSSGKLVQKMKKSMKKEDIKRCLLKSPLFLNDFDCVIIDEAQKLSNNTSIRYKTIYDFLKKANPRYIFLLTGTPLTNTPLNLYHILKLISCDVTSDYNYYITHYCGAVKHNKRDGGHYYTFGEISNLDELREKIKDNYIRRLTSDVGTMVRKNVEMRYFDLDDEQKERYKKLWSDYVKAQEGYQVTIESYYDDYWDEYTEESDLDKNRKLIEGSLIRQFFGREMVQHTIDTVNELLEDGEKVVIMTVFKEELRRFKEYYGDKAVIFRGGMTPKQKEKAENAFNNDKNVKVFIGQIIAAGVGLNLDSASYLIFNNYDWVAANNIQAESRIHRLTQKKDVTCIYMLFDESISEEMFNKVIYKEMLMNETIKSENQKNLKL